MMLRVARILSVSVLCLSVVACAGTPQNRVVEIAPATQLALQDEAAPAVTLVAAHPVVATRPTVTANASPAFLMPKSDCQINFEEKIAAALKAIEERRRNS